VESDWSVAAGADDPVIEAHWSDAASGLAWVDLRVSEELQQSRIAALPEAVASPAMARALALLNAPRGMLMTSKCDRWPLDQAEQADLAEALDASPAGYGFGSYIDVVMVHTIPMTDFLLHEEWARTAARRCAGLNVPDGRVEMLVRPGHKNGMWGFGMSVYCYASGRDQAAAEMAWAEALERVIPIVIAAAEELFVSPEELSNGDYPDRCEG
jgi:rhodanese-related sulfurtransferase